MIALIAAVAMAGIVAKGLGVIAIIFAAGIVVGIILTTTVVRRFGSRKR